MAERVLSFGTLRWWWPIAAGVVIGLLIGLLVSLLGPSTRRAEASVLISSPAGPPAVEPMLPNLRELATSSVVAGNLRSTLRLSESTETVRRRLKATVRPQSQVIAISATDSVAEHARQVAQEAAVVFAQLVEARFATGKPELHAAVLDSAHVLDGPNRHLVRNLSIGGLVGVLLGSAAMFVLATGVRRSVVEAADDSDPTRREQLLGERVRSVSARERALAAHAGKLTARELELEARAAKLSASESEFAARTAAAPPPPPQPAPTPEPAPTPVEPAVPAPPSPELPLSREPEPLGGGVFRTGAWNLNDLQRALDAHRGASPERAEEWRAYLFFLREYASADGSLPRSLDGLLSDVFAELLD